MASRREQARRREYAMLYCVLHEGATSKHVTGGGSFGDREQTPGIKENILGLYFASEGKRLIENAKDKPWLREGVSERILRILQLMEKSVSNQKKFELNKRVYKCLHE